MTEEVQPEQDFMEELISSEDMYHDFKLSGDVMIFGHPAVISTMVRIDTAPDFDPNDDWAMSFTLTVVNGEDTPPVEIPHNGFVCGLKVITLQRGGDNLLINIATQDIGDIVKWGNVSHVELTQIMVTLNPELDPSDLIQKFLPGTKLYMAISIAKKEDVALPADNDSLDSSEAVAV